MYADQIRRTHKGIDIFGLMIRLYSYRWMLHPEGQNQEERLSLYLESLIDTGELKKVNDEYVVTGKAIATIERYEEEVSRHSDSIRLRKIVIALTVAIVLMMIIQAEIVKLPTLLDLS